MTDSTPRPVRWWLAIPLLVGSGSLQFLVSPPLSLWMVHLVCWAPGLYVLRRAGGGARGLLAGVLLGASANIAIFWWIVNAVGTFSNLPVPVAVLVMLGFAVVWGFYVGVFGWGLQAVSRSAGAWWPVAMAAWFTTCEYLHPQLFTNYQGAVWYQEARVFLVTGLVGLPGMTFGVLLANAVVLAIVVAVTEPSDHAKRAVVRGAGALLVFALVAVGYSQVRLAKIAAAEADAPTTRFALVQTNLDVFAARRLRRADILGTANLYVEQSLAALQADPEIDVFVYPEGALRGAVDGPRNRRVLDFVRDQGTEVWTGAAVEAMRPDGESAAHNAAARVHGGGELDTEYYKNILLPFGEFMPLAGVFPILNRIEGVGDFEPGDGLVHFDTPHGRFVFLICYEAIRHRYVREGVNRGVDVLVNITYDAWFGRTSNPSQHLMLAASQSAAYGVPLVRAATTGHSAFVDARGLIRAQTDIFTQDTLVRDVKRLRVPTIYSRVGDWFAWLCIVATGGLLVAGSRDGTRWQRGARLAWAAVFVGALAVPLAWLSNPYMPVVDWLMWVFAVVCVLAVAARRWSGSGDR